MIAHKLAIEFEYEKDVSALHAVLAAELKRGAYTGESYRVLDQTERALCHLGAKPAKPWLKPPLPLPELTVFG